MKKARMRRMWILGAMAVGTLAAWSCGDTKETAGGAPPRAAATPGAPKTTEAYPPERVVKGQTLFEHTCAACHGLDAKGIQGLGKNLTTSPYVGGKTDDDLVAFIKQGRTSADPLNTTGVAMPPKGGNPALTEDDLKALVAFLRSVHAQ